ncbi:MAG TPA: hypothetical protein VGA61_21610 [Anaerolineae bacterium]
MRFLIGVCLLSLWLGWLPREGIDANLSQTLPAAPAAAPGNVAVAGPEAVARQRALAWLHAQQLPDGSFGQRLSDGTFSGDPASTADVVYVLALAGADPAGPAWTVKEHSALQALAGLTPGYAEADAGQAGKIARAVAASGHDVRSFAGLDLVKIIEGFYNAKTGRYHPELLYRNTLAIEGLARAGVAVPPAAVDALLAARLPDGGWFWAFQGETSDLDTTGFVLDILSTYGGLRCAPALAPAADYVAGQQAAAGAWGATTPPGPPNANSTALAVAGLAAAGYDLAGDVRLTRAGRDPLASLLAFQEASGAFVYIPQPGREEVRLAATTDALTALAPATLAPLQSNTFCGAWYLPVRLAG